MTLIKTPKSNGRRRLIFRCAGILLAAALVWPAWRQWDSRSREQAGIHAMGQSEYAKSAAIFEAATEAYPRDKKMAFLAAVAYRRGGNVTKFEEFLRRAERLGYDPGLLRIQRLLQRTQHGLGDAECQAELDRVCLQGTDDFTAEQIYEARAKGAMSVYRLQDALQALGYWIEWQPRAVVPRLLRAELYEDKDDIRHAEMDYRAIVEACPDHLEGRLRLAECLMLSRKNQEAITHFEACARLSPGNPQIKMAMAEIEYRSGGDLAQVEKTLTELLKAEDLEVALRQRGWMILSSIYLARKEYGKVISLLETGAEQGDLDSPAYQALIRAHRALKQDDKAQHYLKLQETTRAQHDEVFALHDQVWKEPTNPIPRYRLGNKFYEMGNKKGALTWWYTAVLAEPLHQPSHERLAEYYESQGDAARSLQHRQLAEKSVERTFRLAWTDLENNDFESLRYKLPFIAKYPAYRPHVQLLELALKVKVEWGKKPQDRSLTDADLSPLYDLSKYPHLRKYAQTALGGGLFALGDMGVAEETLLEVIKSDPNFIEAHRWLLSINFDIRAFDRAKIHADTIARLDPKDFRPHRLLGLMAKVMQSWDLAIAAYQQALRRNPKPEVLQEILMELGECQTRSRKYEEALKTFQTATESVERDVLVAECLLHTGRATEALPLLNATLEKEPKNPAANLLMADCILEQKGDLEVARQHVQTILDKYPFSDSAWFKLSQIYGKQNKPEEAKKASERSTELRDFQIQYSRQIEIAVIDPENIEVRAELEAIARQFGRTDLAEEWARAIELLKSKKKTSGGGAAPGEPRRAPVLVTPETGGGPVQNSVTSPSLETTTAP